MDTRITVRLLAAFAVAALTLPCTARAGLFRAYLSVNGNDANPCTVTAPCRLLPAALGAISDGGEIWIMDSANFNTGTVNVTKSVTIVAVPGALGSVVANGGDAISINAADIRVTLRNLHVLFLTGSSANGVLVQQGQELTVENCEFYGLNVGINVRSTTRVSVKDTTLRDSFTGFDAAGSIDATLDGVRISGNARGVTAEVGSHVTVTNSVLANNGVALQSLGSAGGSVLVVARSSITGHPLFTGIYVDAPPGTTAEAVAEANVLHVGIGFNFAGGGGSEIIYSSGDNKLVFYTSAVGGGTLTPLGSY